MVSNPFFYTSLPISDMICCHVQNYTLYIVLYIIARVRTDHQVGFLNMLLMCSAFFLHLLFGNEIPKISCRAGPICKILVKLISWIFKLQLPPKSWCYRYYQNFDFCEIPTNMSRYRYKIRHYQVILLSAYCKQISVIPIAYYWYRNTDKWITQYCKSIPKTDIRNTANHLQVSILRMHISPPLDSSHQLQPNIKYILYK